MIQAHTIRKRSSARKKTAARNPKGALSVKEMYARFDSEWILVIDPKMTDSFEVLSGRVACHSKSRDEVYQKALELRPKSSAILYNGRLPKNTAIIL